MIWRLNANKPRESLPYGIENLLGRKVEMSPLHDDRSILWCNKEKEKEELQVLGIVTLLNVSNVKITPSSPELQDDNIQVECRYS